MTIYDKMKEELNEIILDEKAVSDKIVVESMKKSNDINTFLRYVLTETVNVILRDKLNEKRDEFEDITDMLKATFGIVEKYYNVTNINAKGLNGMSKDYIGNDVFNKVNKMLKRKDKLTDIYLNIFDYLISFDKTTKSPKEIRLIFEHLSMNMVVIAGIIKEGDDSDE